MGNVQEKVELLEKEKNELGKTAHETNEINKQLKDLLKDKDSIISRMQAELEKFVSIKNEIGPIFKESLELKKALAGKDEEIDLLKKSLTEATSAVGDLPQIEEYIKQASNVIKQIGDENKTLKTQVYNFYSSCLSQTIKTKY